MPNCTKVRAAHVAAEAKAAQIRTGIETGSVPNLTDILNSPLIQRLVEQQVSLKAQIAQLSATFLPGHPRMQELNAQVKDLDRQIAGEAKKILDSVEADAKLWKGREDDIVRSVDQLKVTATTANDAGVQLRALEREATAQRDLLDTYLRRYREALSRQNGDYLPADARIVSQASVAIEPDFPKKIPMTAAASVAILILAIAFILIRELASGRPMREVRIEPLPVVPDEKPVGGHVRWADDHGIRRMMPSEPTLAPEMESEVERSLAAIGERIVNEGRQRVIVTLADGSDASRPPARGGGPGAGAGEIRPARRAGRSPWRRRRQRHHGGGRRPARLHRPLCRRRFLRPGDLPRPQVAGAFHSRRPQAVSGNACRPTWSAPSSRRSTTPTTTSSSMPATTSSTCSVPPPPPPSW